MIAVLGSTVFLVAVLALIILFLNFVPLGLWISAMAAGVNVHIFTLVGMRLRRVIPSKIILPLVKANKAGLDVNVVICGGIGDGAMASLEAAGIAVHSGVNGFCDAAARAFKNGKLESLQCSTCDSHGPEGCSHSCSSCGH